MRAAIPSFEEVFADIVDAVDFSRDNTKTQQISPKRKQHYKEFDLHPDRLVMAGYEDATQKLTEQLMLSVNNFPKTLAQLFRGELKELLLRYENLLRTITMGRARPDQTKWILCVRFFLPWAALRLAFHNRRHPVTISNKAASWFLPYVERGKISSCFMQVVDGCVRNQSESQSALAVRLCKLSGRGDPKEFGVELSRYRNRRALPPDTAINRILDGCDGDDQLGAKLILARAIDRCIGDACRRFKLKQTIALVKYYRLMFDHCQQLMQTLQPDLAGKDDVEAWLLLQSMTFTGNTTFDNERVHPLTDLYMVKLGSLISSELGQGNIATCPSMRTEMRRAQFKPLLFQPLPTDIHEAVRSGKYLAAIELSRRMFPSGSSESDLAAHVGQFFGGVAMLVYELPSLVNPLKPRHADAPRVMAEALRLQELAYETSTGMQRLQHATSLLRFLLEPQRPKTRMERLLAWKLLRIVAKHYRSVGRHGSAHYLLGCLRWLEGEENEAVKFFRLAVDCGRASCGEDWIWLLRSAPSLAKSTGSKQARKLFLRLSNHEGVLHKQSARKTGIISRELKLQDEAHEFEMRLQSFPR